MRKKRNQKNNRNSIICISLIVVMLMGMLSLKGFQLQQKNAEYKQKEKQLTAELKNEKERTKEIEEFKKYTQTKKYVEEVAKDKLGLVYPGEIIFKPEEK